MRNEITPKTLIAVIAGALLVVGLIAYLALRTPGGDGSVVINGKTVSDAPAAQEAQMKQFMQDPASQGKHGGEGPPGDMPGNPNAPSPMGGTPAGSPPPGSPQTGDK